MRVFVFTDGNGVATLVREGSPEEEGMRELPHMRQEGEYQCETLDDAIAWFRQWSADYFGTPARVL